MRPVAQRPGPATGLPTRTGQEDLDLVLHAGFSRAYLEFLAGPWILFAHDPVRAHIAAGFGLRARAVTVGLELGWLDPRAIIGLRVSFAL